MLSNILQMNNSNPQFQTPGIPMQTPQIQQPQSIPTQPILFDVNDFIADVAKNAHDRNNQIITNSNTISGYDIASNCIRETVYKILNYPVDSYDTVWLPVVFRAALGNAVHEFIQTNSKVFTEAECSLKIPSIRASTRIDNLINNNVLVEIKSCTYSDYSKIINTRTPRTPDFYQAIFYRYLLMKHLEEAQQQPRQSLRSDPPKLSKYNINTIQLIYVAHDLLSADSESVTQAIKTATAIKKLLDSKHNKFYFITALTIDLNVIDVTPYENYVIEKYQTINYYINQNIIPPKDNKFVKSDCFFCMYKKICKRT